ncbi:MULTISPECIES: HDIG domain-containing metalloprotein [unclassified Romboutsia]|uniref:HDIG domain-containing metalloprotein n=1 Tax=unclassified Romboutsia TaxID=2626894 RepID=UPI0008230C51|nr:MULTISPECIES: HD domain-containing protein [unclassified Romboutsia]SCH62922.1 multifunctional tRNA nucleotidyl transferase/2'3'-cyclic phosphodiesterase/2'nucleotidase/phosphatase [uncultured Clostridium sp.]
MTQKNMYYNLNEILINNEKPSNEIRELIDKGEFDKKPLDLIKNLAKIDQNKKYHPEGNVLNHVLLVIDEAAKNRDLSNNKEVFMWSAFLHDIGKLTTTKIRKGRITSYNHDIEGEDISYDILEKLGASDYIKKSVSKLVRYHMQPLYFDKSLPFFEPSKMLKECDYRDVALLSLCDRLGRGKITKDIIDMEYKKIDAFKKYCNKALK